MIATGQVIAVRPLGHGFGVTLGPPPRFLYVVTSEPPKLGASVQVTGRVVETLELADGFTLERIEGEVLVDGSVRQRRLVYREWEERAALVWSRELYAYQLEGAAWLASRLAEGKGGILADAPGLGKQQPVDALVLTPTGYRPIGELKVGDRVVGSAGRTVSVTGVFPQGIKPSLRVLVSDGSSVEAGPEHLWTTLYQRGGGRGGGQASAELLLTTDQLHKRPQIATRRPSGQRGVLSLDKTALYLPMLRGPVVFDGVELPLPPYLIGQLISNGCMTGASCALTVNTLDWPHIHGRLLAEGAPLGAIDLNRGTVARVIVVTIMPAIRKLGLDVYSVEKFIPEVYRRASPKDRIALLHGLMDGDGSISVTRNKVAYHTISLRLANDVCSLVELLGGMATVRRYDRTAEDKPVEYQVRVRLPPTIRPFSSPRKDGRYAPTRHAYPTRRIVGVEPVREAESVCISVDAKDGLYVTEHGLLTHNTSQALAAVLATQCMPTLVVCPLTLKQEWLREIQHAKEDLKVEVLTGRNGFVHPAHVYLANYDILQAREQQLGLMGCRSVIFDEAQALINHRAEGTHRAAVATRIAHRIGRPIALTGTPLLNNIREYWRLLHLVDPMSWPSFEAYSERYCRRPTEDEFREDPSTESRVETQHGRAERVQELQSRVEHVMLRRTKEEVAADLPPLPPKTRRVVEVDLEPEDMAFYEKTRTDFATWYVATGKHMKKADRQSEALRRIGVLRQIAAIGKARRAVPDYFATWFGSPVVKPLVVFGYHRKPLAIVEQAARKMGLRASVLRTVGPLATEAERKKVVDQFRSGETDLLLAPIRAAGVGLNLQTAADALFLEWTWVPADHEQAENRIHRIGQDKNVVVTYLLARGTIDEHMAALVTGKQVLIDEVLDGVVDPHAK